MQTLGQAVVNANRILDAAKYFLDKLRETERYSHRRLGDARQEFENYLFAFLAATRSGSQILSEVVGWPQINAISKTWQPDDESLWNALRDKRNQIMHTGEQAADSSLEYVPQSQLPSEPRDWSQGYVYLSRPPGVPEPRIGRLVFTIPIEGRNEPAVGSCVRYLHLTGRVVGHFAATLPPDNQ